MTGLNTTAQHPPAGNADAIALLQTPEPARQTSVCPACEEGIHNDALCDLAVAQRIIRCGCACHVGAATASEGGDDCERVPRGVER